MRDPPRAVRHRPLLGPQTSTKLKVTGIDLFSAGNFMGGEGTEEIVLSDPIGGVYKKLVLQNDKLVGTCLYGDTVDGNWYLKLLREGRPIGDLRDRLMFGESNIGDVGHEGHTARRRDGRRRRGVRLNGVNKGAICKPSRARACSRSKRCASKPRQRRCGSCTGLVEQLLMFTAGGDYSAPAKKAMCGCSDASHQEAREAIRAEHLLTIATLRVLGWRTPNGCSSCRPAINYYLISTWPGKPATIRRAASSTSAATPTSRRTAPTRWFRACGAARPPPANCAASPTWSTSTRSAGQTDRGQRIDLLGLRKTTFPRSGRISACLRAMPTPRHCAP